MVRCASSNPLYQCNADIMQHILEGTTPKPNDCTHDGYPATPVVICGPHRFVRLSIYKLSFKVLQACRVHLPNLTKEKHAKHNGQCDAPIRRNLQSLTQAWTAKALHLHSRHFPSQKANPYIPLQKSNSNPRSCKASAHVEASIMRTGFRV